MPYFTLEGLFPKSVKYNYVYVTYSAMPPMSCWTSVVIVFSVTASRNAAVLSLIFIYICIAIFL
jgi:hypothetical protein